MVSFLCHLHDFIITQQKVKENTFCIFFYLLLFPLESFLVKKFYGIFFNSY